MQHGVEVVYVSNHGGRQLDHGLGSAAVLPEIVQAVAGRAEVWVDGGFMRGTDIVKAIALGAKTVGLGRLPCLGLAAAGVPGLVRALEILENEVQTCLGLLGVDLVRRTHAAAHHRRAARRRARRVQRISAARRPFRNRDYLASGLKLNFCVPSESSAIAPPVGFTNTTTPSR